MRLSMETSFISVVVFAIAVTSIQAPFSELLESADGENVVPRFLHDLMERKPVHGIVADGTAELHGSTGALGLQKGVNVDGYIGLGQVFAVQATAGYGVSHIAA